MKFNYPGKPIQGEETINKCIMPIHYFPEKEIHETLQYRDHSLHVPWLDQLSWSQKVTYPSCFDQFTTLCDPISY